MGKRVHPSCRSGSASPGTGIVTDRGQRLPATPPPHFWRLHGGVSYLHPEKGSVRQDLMALSPMSGFRQLPPAALCQEVTADASSDGNPPHRSPGRTLPPGELAAAPLEGVLVPDPVLPAARRPPWGLSVPAEGGEAQQQASTLRGEDPSRTCLRLSPSSSGGRGTCGGRGASAGLPRWAANTVFGGGVGVTLSSVPQPRRLRGWVFLAGF